MAKPFSSSSSKLRGAAQFFDRRMKLGNSAAAPPRARFSEGPPLPRLGLWAFLGKYLAVAPHAWRRGRRGVRGAARSAATAPPVLRLGRAQRVEASCAASAPFEASTTWRNDAGYKQRPTRRDLEVDTGSGSDAMMRLPVNSVTKHRAASTAAASSPPFDRKPTPKSQITSVSENRRTTGARLRWRCRYVLRPTAAKKEGCAYGCVDNVKNEDGGWLSIEHSPRQNASQHISQRRVVR